MTLEPRLMYVHMKRWAGEHGARGRARAAQRAGAHVDDPRRATGVGSIGGRSQSGHLDTLLRHLAANGAIHARLNHCPTADSDGNGMGGPVC